MTGKEQKVKVVADGKTHTDQKDIVGSFLKKTRKKEMMMMNGDDKKAIWSPQ